MMADSLQVSRRLFSVRPGMVMKRKYACLIAVLFLSACRSSGVEPMQSVEYVDLDRFMGDWYVIASIPTPFERGAHNAIERYDLSGVGKIDTIFSYNEDGFDGRRKNMRAKGFVQDKKTNAIWGMQFVWPFKADYRVIYLDDDYTTTIIGRQKRDYVWIMSRSSTMAEGVLDAHTSWLAELGYDTSALVRIPHRSADELVAAR
jgi:apolipoprotein D and lipocalin family protein